MKAPDIKNIIIAVLAICLTISLVKCGKSNKENKELISQAQLNQQTLDSIKNVYGQIVVEQEAIITHSKASLKAVTDTLFNLRKSDTKKIKDVIAYYKGITKTSIKSVDVPYVDTAKMKKWEDSVAKECSQVISYYESNYLQVPRHAIDSTADYKADLEANMSGIHINELTALDSQYIRFATLKGGLLKKDISGKRHFILGKKIVAQVLHTNKLITITGQNSAIYQPPNKPRWLEKAVFTAIGAIGTIIINNQN